MSQKDSKTPKRLLDRAIHGSVFQEKYTDVIPKYSTDWFHGSKIIVKLFELEVKSVEYFWDEDCWGCTIIWQSLDLEAQLIVRQSGPTALEALCRSALDYCQKQKKT